MKRPRSPLGKCALQVVFGGLFRPPSAAAAEARRLSGLVGDLIRQSGPGSGLAEACFTRFDLPAVLALLGPGREGPRSLAGPDFKPVCRRGGDQ